MNPIDFLSAQPAIVLLFILIGYLAIGDVISLKTRAFLPSIFVFSLLVLLTSWAGLIPPQIFVLSGASSPLTSVVSLLIVVDMGTSMNISDIVKNWRVAIIGLVAIGGAAICVLGIGTQIFGWQSAVVSAPVVAGGIVASLEMQNAAKEVGNEGLAIVAALILAFQSFPGFILTPILLKRSMKRQVKATGHANISSNTAPANADTNCKIPEQYLTTAMLLAIGCAVGVLAYICSSITKLFMGSFAISQSIFGLLFGILFTAIGLTPKSIMKRAFCSGLVLTLTIFSAFGVLATTSFDDIAAVAGPVIGNIVLGIIGIFTLCIIVGKIFKMDWELAVALGLNCLLGFPLNYQLTLESIKALTTDPVEAQKLEEQYMPMMLVAGFVTITIGSVVLAGFLQNFL
jgi:hypothetical protein